MLNENVTSAVSTAPNNVGLTAFQVAVVQAKVFKQTLEDVSDRREQEAKAAEQKAEEQRQRVRERLADLRGGVDVVVERSESSTGSATKEAPQPAQGREVDIEV